MRKYIYIFLLGFIFNSIIIRLDGTVPKDDIVFPVGIFVTLLISLYAAWKSEND